MKIIKLSKEIITGAKVAFEKYLVDSRSNDSKVINFNYIVPKREEAEAESPRICILADAFLKMQALIEYTPTEIGWHGTVEKYEDNTYVITDILVYPQTVTGVTVTTEETQYGSWLHNKLNDDQINSLRFHGHSHVHMGVSPSGTDTNHYETILETLGEDDFYIFLIKNKKGDTYLTMYDLAHNTIFEDKDLVLEVLFNNAESLEDWVDEEKEANITKPVVATGFQPINPAEKDRLDKISEYKGTMSSKVIKESKKKEKDKTGYTNVDTTKWTNKQWQDYYKQLDIEMDRVRWGSEDY